MLASTIVHEAQHARLFRLGIGYEVEIMARVEQVCYTAQKILGLRIPNGDEVVEYANEKLRGDIEYEYSDVASIEADFNALDELGCPLWIQKLLRWHVNRKIKNYQNDNKQD
ncbi:MAG: hypothetical protein BMS9Abin26_0398 [Gammaproteobacteria bacterium]|nr:MAG: hypothetical protein BMS9Abin26_0398 [Gammaproteobacteria bacterium]